MFWMMQLLYDVVDYLYVICKFFSSNLIFPSMLYNFLVKNLPGQSPTAVTRLTFLWTSTKFSSRGEFSPRNSEKKIFFWGHRLEVPYFFYLFNKFSVDSSKFLCFAGLGDIIQWDKRWALAVGAVLRYIAEFNAFTWEKNWLLLYYTG